MGVSEPFIRRPIATSLLGIALLIGGLLGYFALPGSALPQVDFPTVQAAINAAAGVLPKTLPYPPTYAKVNPADAPVMTLALRSDTISLPVMSDIADTILA